MPQFIRIDRPFQDTPGTAFFTCAIEREEYRSHSWLPPFGLTPEASQASVVELFPMGETDLHTILEGFAWVPPEACEMQLVQGHRPREILALPEDVSESYAAVLRELQFLVVRIVDEGGKEHRLAWKDHLIRRVDIRPESKLARRMRMIVDLGRFGVMNVFVTAYTGSPVVRVDIDWSNAEFPGPGSITFREVGFETKLAMLALLDDPSVDAKEKLIVRRGEHRLSARRQRPFRLLFWQPSVTSWERVKAVQDLEGWGTGDWFSVGGFLETGFGAPHSNGGLVDEVIREYQRMHDDFRRVKQPSVMGPKAPPPVSFFWNAYGSPYGGMTGGLDVEQYSGIETAATASRFGLKRHMIEATRYRCRQMGAIYRGGHPVEPTEYTDEDGRAQWRMYNSVFQKSGGRRLTGPFTYKEDETRFGDDPGRYDTIDDQHDVRQYASTVALVFLTNDLLSRLYLDTDERLSRMTWWQGEGRARRWPTFEPKRGVAFGRAEAWNARLVSISHLFGPTKPKDAWLRKFAQVLVDAQTPSGLFGAMIGKSSKIPADPPYHGDFWVHRANEQCYLLFALCGIANVMRSRKSLLPTIEAHIHGLWELAWWYGRGGVIERYCIGTKRSGPVWTERSDRPENLPRKPSYADGYQCGSALAHGWSFGGYYEPRMLLDYTGAKDVDEAQRKLEALGAYHKDKAMASFGPTLWLLQRKGLGRNR